MENKDSRNESELLKNAENGNPEAQYKLGIQCLGIKEVSDGISFCWQTTASIHEEAYTEGISWLEKAAEQGFEKAQLALGEFYCDGFSFVKAGKPYRILKRNVERGVYWYTTAAEKKNKRAAEMLGWFYLNEKNFDFEKSIYWFARAEKYYFVARLYEGKKLSIYDHKTGCGKRDYEKALEYYKLAFAHKDRDIAYDEYFEDYENIVIWMGAIENELITRVLQAKGQRQEIMDDLEEKIKRYEYLVEKLEIGQAAFKEDLNDAVHEFMNVRSILSMSDVDENSMKEQLETILQRRRKMLSLSSLLDEEDYD